MQDQHSKEHEGNKYTWIMRHTQRQASREKTGAIISMKLYQKQKVFLMKLRGILQRDGRARKVHTQHKEEDEGRSIYHVPPLFLC